MFGTSAHALTLFPVAIKVKTSEGQTQTHTIRVFNEHKNPIQVIPSLEDWILQNGKRSFLKSGAAPFGLSPYVKMDTSSFVLKGRESRLISVNVTVPADKLGGHYTMAYFLATPYDPAPQQEKVAKMKVAVKLGTMVLQEDKASVSIRSRILACEIEPDKQGLKVPLKVLNEGNTYLDVSGTIAIMDHQDNFLGSFKTPKKHIVRGESTELVGKWSYKLKPGSYQALITYHYRDQSTTITRNFTIPKP
jgi:hypothetical protein